LSRTTRGRGSVCFLLGLLAAGLCGRAQPGRAEFERLSIEQGLSQSIVERIVQDHQGFLWFCTEDGLNRYDGYSFLVLRKDPANPDSLSHNHARTALVDRQGRLWVGTFNGGLNRYDPKTGHVVRYLHDPARPDSLSYDVVTALCQDRTGALWVGTIHGLNRLPASGVEAARGQPARFEVLGHDAAAPDSLGNDTVRAICEDRAGTLWVGTDGGLNRLLPGAVPRFVRYRHDVRDQASLGHDTVRAVIQTRDGALWVGTDGGLDRLDAGAGTSSAAALRGGFVHYRHDPADPGSLGHDQVFALLEDRRGRLWVATNGGGLDLLDRASQRFQHFRHADSDPLSLGHDSLRSLFESADGNLWIGTYGGGISKLRQSQKAFRHVRAEPGGLNDAIVWCFHQDGDGTLWVGTNGGGLNRRDPVSGRFTAYRARPQDPRALSRDVVRQIVPDRYGFLWIGTDGGGLCRFDRRSGQFAVFRHDPARPASLSHDEIRSLTLDQTGAIWVGTQGGGLDRFLPGPAFATPPVFDHFRHDPGNPASLANDYIRQVLPDRAGAIWVCTYGGGLDRYDPAHGTFVHHPAVVPGANGLSSNHTFAICEDRQGALWVATWGGGLNRFDRRTNRWRCFTEQDGLPSMSIYGIRQDLRGDLWLSSNNGLSKLDPRSLTIRNYVVKDGLQSKEFNGGASYLSGRGELFFGGINGFNEFFPDQIVDNPHLPPVVITAFQKLNRPVRFDRPTPEVKRIELSYQDYVFSFEFAALDFTAPETNRYAYRLEGVDREWQYVPASRRFASYTTLAPGAYMFHVKGTNNDGIWNEAGTSVTVVITPPFWRTWWFSLLLLLAVTGLTWHLIRRRLKYVRLHTEMKAAHRAQMSIMPQRDPRVEGFQISAMSRPALEVGGDFYDFFWFDEPRGRLAILLGDVSGKGLRAAMTAAMASGMIRAGTLAGESVGEVLTRINAPLKSKIERDVFVAALLMILDTASKALVFTNAGLIRPILLSGGSATQLRSEGVPFPLGMNLSFVYREQRMQLASGDTLVLMSDGIPEAHDPDRRLYGQERLLELLTGLSGQRLSAGEIRDRILADVAAFVGPADQHDDITLLVLRVL